MEDRIAINVLNEFNEFTNPPQIGPNLYGNEYEEKRKEYMDEFLKLDKDIKKEYTALEVTFTDEYSIQHYMVFEDSSAIKFNYGTCHIIDGIDCPYSYEDLKET